MKDKTIVNLKIAGKFGIGVAPYVLVPFIMTGAFKAMDLGTPFFRDSYFVSEKTMTEVNSNGGVHTESSFQDFPSSIDSISHYDKWEEKEDGYFYRSVQSYDTKNFSKEELLNLVSENKGSLEEIFGEPIQEKEEVWNDLDFTKMENQEFIEARIFDENKENTILIKETVKENVCMSVFYLLFTFLFELFPYEYRKNISHFDFDDEVEKIKCKYKIQ